MAPSSTSNSLSSPPHDTEGQHHERLFLTTEQDEMVGNIKTIFQCMLI